MNRWENRVPRTIKLSDRTSDMSRPTNQRQNGKAQPGSLERCVVLLRCIEKKQDKIDLLRRVVWQQAGERMRKARETSQLSVREAAKRLGISAPYLSDMELGRRQPSVKWLEKLSHVIKQHNAPGEPLRPE